MTGLLNDRYYLNLLLGVLFVLGMGLSLYFIYSLPDSLHLTSGFQPEFILVYSVVGLTFVTGALAVLSSMRYKKEIIVFRDRITDTGSAEGENGDQAGKTTISLEAVKSSLQQAEGEKELLQSALQAISKQLEAGQGAIYRVQEDDGKRVLELKSGYALSIGESTVIRYEFGEGLIGQAAVSGRTVYIDDVPNGYVRIISGLGSASPKYLLIVPVKKQEQVRGVIELASFTPLSEDQRRFAEESAQLIAEKI